MEKEKRKEEKELEAQGGDKKVPYPMSVFFIIGNEFCERFSYYGMKAILSIYLKNKLKFEEHRATSLYHGFSMMCYFTPIFGALLADTLLGKFKTIVSISIVYVLGHLFKTLAAIPNTLDPVGFSIFGLVLIAIGTGGIKPCVAAFGGDQFKLPEQTRQLQTFFSVFYFSINAGSLVSTILTPVLREDVECFGEETCYSLAFGVPAVLMLIATVIIVIGKPMYVMKPPQGNVLTGAVGSIYFAVKEKFAGKTANHWLDLAKTKYDGNLVEDVKALLPLLLLYLPLPLWWALFDQTGSAWTFQAQRMDGVLGGTIVKPDQMQVANPVMILLFIPLFDKVVYPAFAKIGFLVKPLQRMTVGGLITALSFVIAGFLELQVSKTYAQIPEKAESHLYVMNTLPCQIDIMMDRNGHTVPFSVPASDSFTKIEIDPEEYSVSVSTESTCLPGILNTYTSDTKITLKSQNVSSLLITRDGANLHPIPLPKLEEPHKLDGSESARLRVFQHMSSPLNKESLLTLEGHETYNVTLMADEKVHQSDYIKIDVGTYKVMLDDEEIGTVSIEGGGVFNLMISKDSESEKMRTDKFVLTPSNSVHIFWLIPQYVVVTVGEVLFSITGLEFSYSQAPESMKSVVQASWLLTVAFGNLIVLIISELQVLDRASTSFMYAIFMALDMAWFAYLAYRYVPREKRNEKENMALENTNGHLNTTYKNDE